METKGEGDSVEVTGRTLAAEAVGAAAQDLGAGLIKKPLPRSGKRRQQQLDLGSFVFAGGNVTNRPPANSPSESDPSNERGQVNRASAEFAGGEDWFEGSLWVTWEKQVDRRGTMESSWSSLRESLEAARQAAKAQAEGVDTNRGDCVVVWNQEYVVHATGAMSSGGKGRVYRYRLQKNGVTYLIADAEHSAPEFPNVRFVVGSLPLMLQDAETIWANIKQDLDDLGGTLERSTLSRVDVCVDLPNVAVAAFEERWRDGRFVTRARESEEYDPADEGASVHWVGRGKDRKCTGIRIGSKGAPLKLNVYDKLYEVTKKRDDAKLEALVKYRWGGSVPSCATRVEVQMRREKIKEMRVPKMRDGEIVTDEAGEVIMVSVDSVDDWFIYRAGVVRYLLLQWLRFTEDEIDRENLHHTRAATWGLWDRIRESAETFFGGAKVEVSRIKRVTYNAAQLIAQTLGTVSSHIVYSAGVIVDKADFVRRAKAALVAAIDAHDWRDYIKRCSRKRSLFEASRPAQCFT